MLRLPEMLHRQTATTGPEAQSARAEPEAEGVETAAVRAPPSLRPSPSRWRSRGCQLHVRTDGLHVICTL